MAGEVPSGIGGLVRYKEEYKSRISLSPTHVIGFIMILVLTTILLRIFFPIA